MLTALAVLKRSKSTLVRLVQPSNMLDSQPWVPSAFRSTPTEETPSAMPNVRTLSLQTYQGGLWSVPAVLSSLPVVLKPCRLPVTPLAGVRRRLPWPSRLQYTSPHRLLALRYPPTPPTVP